MDGERRVIEGDVLVTDGRVVHVGTGFEIPPATRLLDARGKVVLPGFVQGHVHLGQSLFKGMAEGRALLPWLRERIWPLEAAHTDESAYRAAMLGALDCLLSGTTTVCDIGLVRGMEGVFRGIRDSGLRAVAGKCLMDAGDGVPSALREETAAALEEARGFMERWEGEARGRIRTAVCPRFVLSCSRDLWEGAVALSRERNALLHTHLLESEDEEASVREALGMGQLEVLDGVGALDAAPCVAHGVLLDERRLERVGDRRLGVVHCPSANAKLGSGIADLPLLRSRKSVSLGLGCDGAACNNDLDVLEEMRLAALLQGVRHGPGAFSALHALEAATIGGARAVGLGDEAGSLEPGKAGDLVVLDLERPSTFGTEAVSLYDRIVYAAGRDAVRWVVVDGEVLVDGGGFPHVDAGEVWAHADEAARALVSRIPA
jgi:cytosine/adenosine deaminase-related metal-dependent hydrolase